MKKLILVLLVFCGLFATASAQHKAELAQQSNNSIISLPKKPNRLFKKYKSLSQDVITKNLPSRFQSALASDSRKSSEDLITRVENEKVVKND